MIFWSSNIIEFEGMWAMILSRANIDIMIHESGYVATLHAEKTLS